MMEDRLHRRLAATARGLLAAAALAWAASVGSAPAPARHDVPSMAVQDRAAAKSECSAPLRVGFDIARFGSVTAAVWYPTSASEKIQTYASGETGSVARGGELLIGCGTFPLVIFSHGLGGCGTQSVFFTETLARHGYIVMAPDHADSAVCSVDGSRPTSPSFGPNPSVLDPIGWTSTAYFERRTDVETILDTAIATSKWSSVIAADRIGIAGHSLGGYVALGMAGGWNEWKDPRIDAALLFSPYSLPYSIRRTLSDIDVPVMYQGAEYDVGVTPFIEGRFGAYAQSNAPKYFAKLRNGNHFMWTNLQCLGRKTVETCINTRPEAQLINAYGIAFLDRYLKGLEQPLLTAPNAALSRYSFEP
jgi:predicted dienelactone hydrolase